MALTPIEKPLYPNVPRANGVPPVLRSAGAVENAVVQVASDVAQVARMFGLFGPQWGIFDPKTGQAILEADSVISVDYRQEWSIAGYPIEEGAFKNYNKVKAPYDIRIVFAVAGNGDKLGSLIPGGAALALFTGGSTEKRRQSLKLLDKAIATVDLVQVITPEATYDSVNIIHYDYRREARSGAELMRVEVWCQEVRVRPDPALDKSGATDGSGAGGSGSADPGPGSGSGPPANNPGPSSGGNAAAPQQPQGHGPSDGGTVQTAPAAGAGGSGGTGPQLLTIYRNGVATSGTITKGYEYLLGPGETAGPLAPLGTGLPP